MHNNNNSEHRHSQRMIRWEYLVIYVTNKKLLKNTDVEVGNMNLFYGWCIKRFASEE